MRARDSVPGTRSPNEKALNGRARLCPNSGILSPGTRRGMVNYPMATHGKLARPFRAFSGMAERPKALPWAVMELPLWGVNGYTASTWESGTSTRGYG